MNRRQNKVTIVTAADDRYAPLLYELIRSIRDKPESAGIDISVIATGMSQAMAELFSGLADNLVDGYWTIKISKWRMRNREWLQGRAAKPYLPDYFPGYETYLWIDADAWVADWRAIELILEGCRDGSLAMGYDEVDTGFYPGRLTWYLGGVPVIQTYCMKHLRRSHMPRKLLKEIGMARPLNSGVFALRADAEHWASIQHHFETLTRRGRIFGSNQLAYVMAVHLDDLPFNCLPAWCNFMGDPILETGTQRLLMPHLPHEPVGIIHLSNRDKLRCNPHARITLHDLAGQTHASTLRYPVDSENTPEEIRTRLYPLSEC